MSIVVKKLLIISRGQFTYGRPGFVIPTDVTFMFHHMVPLML